MGASEMTNDERRMTKSPYGELTSLALTEAFSMLVVNHAGRRARVSFTMSSSAISVGLSLESGNEITVEPDELGLAILKAVVDSYEISKTAISLRKGAIETLLLDS